MNELEVDSEIVHARRISQDPVRPPPGNRPAKSPIAGECVRIEPLDPAVHAAELFRASHSSDAARRVWDYLPWGPWQNLSAFGSWLRDLAGEDDRVWYAFRRAKDQQIHGMACYLNVVAAHATIEIGAIWFSPEMQRTRAATEALYLMLSHAMDDLGYRRMEWKCNARNARSRAAARRLGFKFEGIFYNHMIVKGVNRDTAWYSILDREWPQVKEHIVGWLAGENFHQNGRAKTSLSEAMTGFRQSNQGAGRSPSARNT